MNPDRPLGGSGSRLGKQLILVGRPPQKRLYMRSLTFLVVGGDKEDGLETCRIGLNERPDNKLNVSHKRLVL